MKAVVTSKNGFYFGDPCYVLGDELYYDVWGHNYEFKDCAVKDPETGLKFAVHGTAFGDGTYSGSDGNVFEVDSGTLAIVPLELVKSADGVDFGGLYLGAGVAKFEEHDGVFTVELPDGSGFTVDTASADEPWDGYDDCDDDMGYDPYLGCYTDDV